MSIRHVLCAMALIAGTHAGAQVCSGGSGGGMDATGNDCNTPPAASAAAEPSRNAALDYRTQAIAAYESGHYPVAARFFRIAAEQGDAHSAETLALMYRYGSRIYGPSFAADPKLAAHWAARASEARARGGLVKTQ